MKLNFRFKKIWLFKYNYVFVIIITLIIVYFLSAFLYKNFYQTIAQTDTIAILKSEVALENVNMDMFEKIQEFNKQKELGHPNLLTPIKTKWQGLKNPYVPYE